MTTQTKQILKTLVKWIGRAVRIGILVLSIVEAILTARDVMTNTQTTQGAIESVRVERHRGTRGRSSTSVQVKYRYEVEGTDYAGHKIWPGWLANMGTSTGGARVARRFHEGRKVTVHYDPSEPADAWLLPQVHNMSIGFNLNLWGFVVLLIMGKTHQRGPKLLRNIGWAVAFGAIGSGMWLLFMGRMSIPVAQLDSRAIRLAEVIGGLFILITVLRFFQVSRKQTATSDA